jgi:hypothetical protein
MAATLTLTETIVHIPEAKWAGAMDFYSNELGEPDKVVPMEAPLQDAREVEWGALHFVRGEQAFMTKGGLELFVGCKNAEAVADGLRDLLSWTGGSVYDPLRQLVVYQAVVGGLPKASTITLASVSVPGQFINTIVDGPDPEDDTPTDDDASEPAAGKQSRDADSKELTDKEFEKSTAERVVLGVIHNPDF